MKINSLGWLCFMGFVVVDTAPVVPGCAAAEPIPYNAGSNVPAGSGVRTLTANTNTPISVLKLQAELLKDLAQEHSNRAAQAAVSNQVERVKWETELAGEFQAQSARLLKVMDQMTKMQNGSEAAPLGAGGAGEVKGVTDEEIEFLAKLEEKRLQVDHELDSTLEQSRFNAMQLATNNLPENVQKIAFIEEENQRYIRNLQKEQSDLDLKRLEYRAIRRFLKK